MDQPPTLPRAKRTWERALGRRRLTELELALTDPKLVSLRCEIARTDIRVAELEELATRGESRTAWVRTKAAVRRLEALCDQAELDADGSDPTLPLEKLRPIMADLDKHITAGLDRYSIWADIQDAQEHRRKLAAEERQYEELHEYTIPMGKLSRVFDDFLRTVEACIPDRALQVRLLDHVIAINNHHAVPHRQPLEVPYPVNVLGPAPADAARGGPDGAVDAELGGEELEEGPESGAQAPGPVA